MDEERDLFSKEPNENDSPSQNGKNAISADLIRGHINTIILRTLCERDKYGYEIIEEIETKSHGQYSLKQPTLYSALKRLETQGYITAYWKNDEVTLGGRRKYYTLTDSGREITEKNQAEWEYSRTVIDNLISDRSFDFSQPAPTAVDFHILKKSTSRVPVVKTEYEEEPEEEKEIKEVKEVKNVAEGLPELKVDPEVVAVKDEVVFYEPIPSRPPVTTPDQLNQNIPEQHITEQPAVEPAPVQTIEREPIKLVEQPIEQRHVEEVPPMNEEQRRIVHENYLRLISEPVKAPPREVEPVPVADEIDTDKLIYNNKPETERDYRNLINKLYVKTVKHPVPEKNYNKRLGPSSNMEDLSSKAASDGLKVHSSDFVISSSNKKSYNRGSALFKSSLIITVILLLEFTLCLLFKKELGINLTYPFVILALAGAQLLIFGVLCYTDLGKNSRKPVSALYMTSCIVITVILIFIIFIVSLLTGINFASVGNVLAKLVIPCIVALNIPIFGLCFYMYSK